MGNNNAAAARILLSDAQDALAKANRLVTD